MTRRLSAFALSCACSFAVLAGCSQQQQGMNNMDPSAMQPPPRPAELDQLNPWVGKWETTAEMTMPDGKKMTGTGSSESAWDLDKRVVIERSTFSMGEMGTMQGMGIFTYCPVTKKFKTAWFSSMGEASMGTMWWDEAKKCWCMKANYISPMTGEPTEFTGTITMPDNNTMNWEMTESTVGFLGMKTKCWEGKGVSKRKA